MSLLKTIFRVFKASGLYDSYTDNQRDAFNKICDVHLNSIKTKEESEVIKQLEMKVSRRVLSASIPVRNLITMMRFGRLRPGQLELVNIIDDIEDKYILAEFLNVFIEKCFEGWENDMHQIKYFPKEAEQYLTDDNLKRLHHLQTI